MGLPALTAAPDDALTDALRLMEDGRVDTLPVVQDRRLVGVITPESVRDFLALQRGRRHRVAAASG
jgi:CBS domain-containing protein